MIIDRDSFHSKTGLSRVDVLLSHTHSDGADWVQNVSPNSPIQLMTCGNFMRQAKVVSSIFLFSFCSICQGFVLLQIMEPTWWRGGENNIITVYKEWWLMPPAERPC